MSPYLIVVIVYLALLIMVGVWKRKKVQTAEDFAVGGRSFRWPILVGTLVATWTGSGSIFNNGRLGYENGFAGLWASSGAWIGIVLIYFIARRIRNIGASSVPQILEKRYDARAGVLASVTTIIAYLTIVSYQFRGGGRVFEIIAGNQQIIAGIENLTLGMIIIALFTIIYTALAGLLSVVYTDVLNGIVAIVGLMLAVPFMLAGIGGFDQLVANTPDVKWDLFGAMGFKSMLALFLPTLLLLMGDANMYQRILSAKDGNQAEKAVAGWIIGVIIIEILIVSLGFIASVRFPGLTGDEAGKILILVAHQGVPFWIGALLLAAILSIIVSTADSFLLVPANNLATDIYGRFLRPDASGEHLLKVSRIAVVVFGFIAFGMIEFFPSILDAAFAAYTIYGAAITPALIAAFVWPRANANAAFASILAGGGVTLVWEILKKVNGTNPFGVEAIYPAAISSIVLLVAISYLTGPAPGDSDS
ncbi:MAG: sodium:solute symporter family protein [Candidatus Marinimicrobia bacterium]|nr:sodium:solute symporter family protein [Candidatus Neomarinimicrobiota bacterium]